MPTDRPIVTLMTDFGLRDTYVAQMKGVMTSQRPGVNIVDLTHAIPPQDIVAAAFQLDDAIDAFPPGTIHLVVVDPGVGTNRDILAVRSGGQFFVGPDNGIFSRILRRDQSAIVIAVDQSKFKRKAGSATFHGRDIMAPIAARLATFKREVSEVDLLQLGQPTRPMLLDATADIEPDLFENTEGRVIWCDHFGNLISNIKVGQRSDLPERADVSIGETEEIPVVRCYAETPRGSLLALIGSAGRLEVAVNGGNASERLNVGVGTSITLTCTPTEAADR
ncbi:Adenosyl-chloride synthase [Stratiformator vulcanicus]|uniref:Adenosyl-chloride synthase n=2 Tax=Stratiformator vulcanicus TaxID=2527980 RepID=A0A517R486_9PLAN|nr:Adenosyl-chloride synthase [Stratiformator vulcanicus]